MRIYIGHDATQQRAFDVARKSAESFGHEVIPLYADRLRASGLLTRPMDTRGGRWDLVSGAPQSTDFALTRFFVPLLAHSGIALYVDSDVVFFRDPEVLVPYSVDAPVSVVKHAIFHLVERKMDSQTQKAYPRKWWSSVMLFNCDHQAHKRLTLDALNGWHRDDLHSLSWLADDEIGPLPAAANWLVGIQGKPPEGPIIGHWTLGVPAMEGHEHDEHAELWLERVSQR